MLAFKNGLFTKALFVLAAATFLAFLLLSLELLVSSSYGSGSVWAESVKILQFCFLVCLIVSVLASQSRVVAWTVGVFLIFLQIIFSVYFLVAKKPLDFMFFALNKSNLVDVFIPYLTGIFWALLLAGLISYFFLKISLSLQDFKKKLAVFLSLVFWLSFPIFKGDIYLNETLAFFKSAFNSDDIISLYQLNYQELVKDSIQDKKLLAQRAADLAGQDRPAYLDNIIFLQLESLNGKLMSPAITPNFYQIASRGINFSNFYANGVQTILGQENLLCALPSSFYSNLNATGNDKKVLCLPKVFKQLGYRTAFFKTYDLNFTNTGEFMRNIGFAETHMEDIMQKNDPSYQWGYREDIFYNRAFTYIKDNFPAKNNFLFLEVGPTNHWPFKTPKDYRKLVPHRNPQSQKERLENTMFLQDKHLGVAWQKINEIFPAKNYTVVVTGDHSWPTGEHPGNEFCGSGPFEENFKTGLTIVFGDGERFKGEKLTARFSQMDILPSFMELLGLELSENKFRRSFLAADQKSLDKQKIVLVQPFSERYLAIINNQDEKAIYNSKQKEWKVFDLQENQAETEEKKLVQGEAAGLTFVQRFIPLVEDHRVVMHALGEVKGVDYTNSKEALEKHLQRRRKFFEVDLTLSADNKIVLTHAKTVKQTEQEFLQGKTRGGFTPLPLVELLQIMEQYPEMVLITDIKHPDYQKTAQQLVAVISETAPQVLSRVLPQIYNKSSFLFTKNELNFEKMLYTLYREAASDQEVLRFVEQHRQHIAGVVMSKWRFNQGLNLSLQELGVETFVHTLNDQKEILKFRQQGVDGIFSDIY